MILYHFLYFRNIFVCFHDIPTLYDYLVFEHHFDIWARLVCNVSGLVANPPTRLDRQKCKNIQKSGVQGVAILSLLITPTNSTHPYFCTNFLYFHNICLNLYKFSAWLFLGLLGLLALSGARTSRSWKSAYHWGVYSTPRLIKKHFKSNRKI